MAESGEERRGETVALRQPGRPEAHRPAIEEGGGPRSWGSGKGKTRADLERAVAQLKKDLPEGLTLEAELDEVAGVITLTVKGAGKTGIPEDIVKKIAASPDERKEIRFRREFVVLSPRGEGSLSDREPSLSRQGCPCHFFPRRKFSR
jgi:hypothetical protein